jgi:hypothetical protein
MTDKLREFITSQDWEILRAVKGWQIKRDDVAPDVVRLSLLARDNERYIVRFVCDSYPELPPKVAFVDEYGADNILTAWPAGNTAFHEVVKLPPHSFLCTDLTREGFQHHPEWKDRLTAWRSTSTLMDLFNYIQDDLLNSTNYEKRAK